jgi:hypothetical protein
VLVPEKPFQPSLKFVGEARSLPYSGAPEKRFTQVALALPANIRLGWKGLPGTNTLAYYKTPKITVAKSFITLATGPGSFYFYIFDLKRIILYWPVSICNGRNNCQTLL